jgi:prepilin-type processing-associated H-X9-DG protein
LGLLLLAVLAIALASFGMQALVRLETRKQLAHIGLALKMYGNDSAGNRWPPLSKNDRVWAMELSRIYPDFLKDPASLVAPEHPEATAIRNAVRAVLEGPSPDYDTAEGLMALSFAYPGHVVLDESDFKSLVNARTLGLLGAEPNTVKLPGGELVFRVREVVDSCFRASATEDYDPIPPGAQFMTPILIETWKWRRERGAGTFDGAHVLYMDGHVAWVPLGTFPVVPSVLDGLCEVTQQGHGIIREPLDE